MILINRMQNIRVKGRNKMLPFQVGFVISANAILQLFEYIGQYSDVRYIFTHRLSQDVLESTFSQIRGFGRFYDHPTR
jgi:hypothetical protein